MKVKIHHNFKIFKSNYMKEDLYELSDDNDNNFAETEK